MGGLDYLVLGLLAVGVFFALRAVRRGAGGCSGGCGGCGRAQSCRRRRPGIWTHK